MATDTTMTAKDARKTLADAAEREAREAEARAVLAEQGRREAEALRAERRAVQTARIGQVIAALESARDALAGLSPEERNRVSFSASTVTINSGRAIELPAWFDGLDRALADEKQRLAKLTRD